jgi:hypothetical protein
LASSGVLGFGPSLGPVPAYSAYLTEQP